MTTHNRQATPGTPADWWMAPGPAHCPWCEQPHHVHAMLYCSACDELICAVCVVVSFGKDPCCPACHDTSGEL